MGTVGISFGSPMGGTGFNVSNTVSQIVANLQNVETPWNKQLTSLQSQDAAISNLGSLLSTLSSDVASFTNFDGVLSEMQGSSSDPNVLALTSASSTAIAGTHTIVVTSLATTSSGYLTGTTSATDQFSGSISIAVGTGAAQTVNIDPSNDTLAGIAASINSAGVGVTASIITDANGSRLSLVSGTSGASGDLSVDTSNLTDTTTPGATLGYTSAISGANANLTVDGISVSSASNTVSNVIPGVTFQLLATSPTTGTTAETVQVQILNDTSAVSSAMEQFVSDYNSVVSAINTQEGNTSSGTPEPLFGNPSLSILQQQILGAIDTSSPSGYLNPIANASDPLSGNISIAVGSGSATNFSLSAGETLAGLAAAINSADIGVTAGVITNSSGSSLSLTSVTVGAAGKLSVTSSVSDGSTALAYHPQGDVNSLTQLGISVNNDGTISLDAATLNDELNSDFSGVVSFFQNSNSWGVDFSNTLNNLGTSSVTGTMALALKADSATESSLNQDISKENLLISAQQISLTAELNSANEILQAIPSNVNNVNELYSAITGYQAPQLG
jgi:flagellar hook-associated protein 2